MRKKEVKRSFYMMKYEKPIANIRIFDNVHAITGVSLSGTEGDSNEDGDFNPFDTSEMNLL